jgi:hypothetical protein
MALSLEILGLGAMIADLIRTDLSFAVAIAFMSCLFSGC